MINLYYDELNSGNGSDGSDTPPCNHPISIIEHFNWCNIPHNVISIQTKFESNDDLNLYVIELFDVERIDELFDNIPTETIKFINENSLKILIYFPIEGFNLDLYNNWFEKLHLCFEKYGLVNVKKYFLFNNIKTQELYRDFLESNPHCESMKFSAVFGYCFFHLEHYCAIVNRWKNLVTRANEWINPEDIFKKQADFISLNAKMRPHRLLLISELSRRNLLANNYVSFLGSDGWDHHEISIEHSFNVITSVLSQHTENYKYITNDILEFLRSYVENWQPIYLDDTVENLDIFKIVPEYYKRAFFSVVTETGMNYTGRITEKTFKPIANYHPFLVVGECDTLHYLRSIGYETFPEMFDESYDQEPDPVNRLFIIINEIEKFCKLDNAEKNSRFKQIYPKLLHNHNMFFNVLPKKNINDYVQIFETIKNDY